MKRNLIIAFFLSVILLSAQDHLVWITANPDTIYFDDNVTYSIIQAKVEDDYNNPVSGATVWFDCDIGNLVHQAATDSNGIAETTFYECGDLGVATITVERNGEYLETQVTIIMPVDSQDEEIPTLIINLSNYPNPFNPLTSISFDIKENETGTLRIFNIKGQLIESHRFGSGKHNYLWDATEQSSGIYLYKLQTESITKTRKMLLLK